MRKLAILACMLAVAGSGLIADTAKIDPKFVETFGSGGVVIASNAVIDRNAYVAANFDYREGKCYVKAGKGSFMSVRFILPAGKTFMSYESSLNPVGSILSLVTPVNLTGTRYYLNYNFYLSNDPATGAVIAKDFPKSPEDVALYWPAGPNEFIRYVNTDSDNGEISSRVDLNNLDRSGAVRAFMAKAKPGWWIYATVNFGKNAYNTKSVVTKATGLKVPSCTGIFVVK